MFGETQTEASNESLLNGLKLAQDLQHSNSSQLHNSNQLFILTKPSTQAWPWGDFSSHPQKFIKKPESWWDISVLCHRCLTA